MRGEDTMIHNITLNKRQVDMLVEIVTNFKDVEWFEIEQDDEDSHVSVRFSMFGDYSEPETTVEIDGWKLN
jgi:hypothetical protein